jgi:hypothetical protein
MRPERGGHPLSEEGTTNGALTTFRVSVYRFVFFEVGTEVNKIFF